MQKISDSTSTATPAGEFTKGSVAGGIPATLITDEWLNTIQREQLSILSAAGIEPSKENDAQILQALRALFAQGTHSHLLSDIKGKPFANFGLWAWATTLSNDPGQGRVALNNADPAQATQLRINETSADGESYSQCLSLLRSGDTITFQDHDSTLAHRFRVTNSATDNGAYRTIPVRYLSGAGGLPADNTVVSVLLTLAGASDDGLPVGSIVPFPKAAVPAGYLELDGSVQSGATYPDLFAYLGTTYNTGGEPAGYFRLPDSRGEFLRGWDHGRGVDAGRVLGSSQGATIVSMGDPSQVSMTVASFYNNVDNDAAGFRAKLNGDGAPVSMPGIQTAAVGASNSVSGDATAMYVRPRNIAVMWCIKAWNAPVNQGQIDIAALAAQVAVSMPREYQTGMVMTMSADLPATTVEFSAGGARGAGNAVWASTAISCVLQSVGAWSPGPGGNKLDVGSRAANAWYHAYVLRKNDNGDRDILFSTSATAPVVPAGYELVLRLKGRAVKTDGSGNIIPFINYGKSTDFKALQRDMRITGGTTRNTTVTVSVPPGVPVRSRHYAGVGGENGVILIRNPDADDVVLGPMAQSGGGTYMGGIGLTNNGIAGENIASYCESRTNVLGQVIAQVYVAPSYALVEAWLYTQGWSED